MNRSRQDRGRQRDDRAGPGRLEHQLDRVVPRASRGGRAFLMVSQGDAAGTVFPLTQRETLIGRSPDADVSIDEQAVSHEHARILSSGGKFSIEDLGSTNGTRVNGSRIDARTRLRSGDSIRTGSTTFTYVSKDSAPPHGTVKLRDERDERAPVVVSPGPAPRALATASSDVHDDDAPLSLTDVVHRVKTIWVYAKRYSWLVATGLLFGIAAGVVQARLNPPPGSAWFEMTLTAGAHGGEDGDIEFFVAPSSTFKSLPLIKKTMTELGHPDVSDADAADIQSFLDFEQVGFGSKLWRGDYLDADSSSAVTFLKTHVGVYVSSEMDKILRLLRDDEKFNREQSEQASAALGEAKAQLLEFIDQHPEAVPRDARDRIVAQEAPGASGGAAGLAGAETAAEQAVSAAIAQFKRRKAEPFRQQAAEADSAIAVELGKGKTRQHPDVRAAQRRADEMRRQAQAALAATPSASELAMDPGVVAARQALQSARTRLQKAGGTASSAPARSPPKTAPRTDPKSLAQSRLLYEELSLKYKSAQNEYAKWAGKLKKTQRELDREETAARGRYAIITPPTPQTVSASRVTMKRAGIGGAVGLMIALVAAACLELRRQLVSRGLL